MSIDTQSVKINTDIAKIFSSILRKGERDMEYANVCIDLALVSHPKSSKLNHRKALLLVQSKVRKNNINLNYNCVHISANYFQKVNEAIPHCEIAVNTDVRNYYAVKDLIKAYLTNTTKYHAKLRDLFNQVKDHPNYKNKEEARAEFLCLEAIFYYFQNLPEDGFKHLKESLDMQDKILYSLQVTFIIESQICEKNRDVGGVEEPGGDLQKNTITFIISLPNSGYFFLMLFLLNHFM